MLADSIHRESSEAQKYDNPVNEYYIGISKHFKALKYICIVLLVLFIVSMIAVFRNEITVENMRYFLKYLDTSSNEYSNGYKIINYSNTGILKTCVFKGDYMVINDESVSLYSMYGVNTYSFKHGYTNPAMKKSSKYVLVYDLAGTSNSYSIYNAFSQIHAESYEYPVSYADIADNGMYAVVTRTDEYRSAVYIYDADFKPVSRIFKEKYIIGIDFIKDGTRLVILSSYEQNGEWNTEVSVLDPYSDKEDAKFTIPDCMGLCVNVYENGGYSVLSTNSVMFYDRDSELVNEYQFGSKTPFTYRMNDKYTVLAFNNNILGNEETIRIYGEDGSIAKEHIFKGKIDDIAVDDEKIYLLSESSIYRFDIEGESNIIQGDCSKSCKAIIPESDYLLLVHQTYTEPVMLNDIFGIEKTTDIK